MAKLKKLNLLRPEIEVEISRPILGRLYLLVLLPKLFKVGSIDFKVYAPGYKETIVRKYHYLCIPKIKVVDCVE